jgi:hypothetical protein
LKWRGKENKWQRKGKSIKFIENIYKDIFSRLVILRLQCNLRVKLAQGSNLNLNSELNLERKKTETENNKKENGEWAQFFDFGPFPIY